MTVYSSCGGASFDFEKRGPETWIFNLRGNGSVRAMRELVRIARAMAPVYFSVMADQPDLARTYQRLGAYPVFSVFEVKP